MSGPRDEFPRIEDDPFNRPPKPPKPNDHTHTIAPIGDDPARDPWTDQPLPRERGKRTPRE